MLWDAAAASCISTFNGNTGYVRSVAFSPDGTTVLTGSTDSKVKLWDVGTSSCTRTFTGHSSQVNSVSFSPDGTLALSGAGDNTAKLWEVAIRTLTVDSTPVAGVSISGGRPGTAKYTAACMDTEVVNLTAPATASIGGRNWFFEYWMIDGQPRSRYISIVSLTMDADHTAVAVYDYAPAGDVDGNCKVNVLDLIQVRNRLGRTCSQ